MFWPMLHGEVDTEGLSFDVTRADTESLNLLAESGDVDIVAISMAQYARVAQDFLLLPHGASVGRGYGPVVVGPAPSGPESLQNARVAIPGARTTAFLVLSLLAPPFVPVPIAISPYEAVFDALRAGHVDLALLVHEGRLTYAREGFHLVLDLGAAWAESTSGLPLPLGGNAIRRALGPEVIARASRVCRASIAWALANRERVMDALLREEVRTGVGLGREMLDRYLAMYANEDTRALEADVRRALAEMFARAHARGLLPAVPPIDLAP